MGYISNFIVYFLAMIGIIILALYVYKQFNVSGIGNKRSNLLSIEDTLSLTPRKTLYVIREGSERFLIAGDLDRTTLISKLEEQDVETIKINPRMIKGADLSENAISAQDKVATMNKPIMKEIRKRINY